MRQEALIGLFEACRAFDPARGSLRTIVGLCVRHRIAYAHRAATALKRQIGSDAIGLDHRVCTDFGELTIADCIAAPDGTDPARVVELRDELRERARPKPRPARRPSPTRFQRRYNDAQVAHALALVAEGQSLNQAAKVIGVAHTTVLRWKRQAA